MPFNSETGAVAGRVATAFRPAFIEEARALAATGWTDREIASHLGVAERTIHSWKLARPEFAEATKIGKAAANGRVERSLYERAVGFHYTEQRALKIKVGPNEERIEIVEIERYMPGSISACILWLKIRCREEWSEKPEEPENGAALARIAAGAISRDPRALDAAY